VHSSEVSLGYSLVEEDRKGRFDPDLARSLGIPEGPLWGKVHKGERVTLDDGRVIEPSVLVGPRRLGRSLAITGDTRPSEATIEAARGADLLIHEATFADEEAARASETGHSTARDAARIAAAAGVRRLALTHFSARYSRDPGELLREAREVFDEVVLARDGMELEIPFPDERTDGAESADAATGSAAKES
jgi:ribonuclease Z